MATLTKTFKEDWYSNYKSTWTFVITGTDLNVTAVGQTLKYAHPTVTAKYVYSGKSYGAAILNAEYKARNITIGYMGKYKEPSSSSSAYMVKMTSGTTYTLANGPSESSTDPELFSVAASRLFDSSNSTTNKIPIYLDSTTFGPGMYGASGTASGTSDSHFKNNSTYKFNEGDVEANLGVIGYIYYKVPPVIGTPTISKNTSGGYFAGKTRVTVSVSSTANYGGTIKETKLTIGNQVKTVTGNPASGNLYIDLNTVGQFTPVLTVTDSRGQVATKNLTAITVQAYSAPAVIVDVERADSAGAPSGSGTKGVITATFTYVSGAGNLVQPVVKVDGSSTEEAVTWYSARRSDGAMDGNSVVNWTNYNPTSPVTLYGLMDREFGPNLGYNISVTPKDSYGSGIAREKQLPSQFFPIDVYGGDANGNGAGQGVSIGQMANGTGFNVGMETHFTDAVYFGNQKVSDIVFGSVVGGAGASSLTVTDANCIGRRFIVATAMDISANVTYAQFINHVSQTDIRSADGQIKFYFSSTLSSNTRVNYIAW